jgi:hypothetical protein
MDTYLIEGSVGLPAGNLLCIEDGAGVLVHVWRGEVWLTEEGGGDDNVLAAGQWFRLERNGKAVLQALSASSIGLSAAEPWTKPRCVDVVSPALAGCATLARPRRFRMPDLRHGLRAAWQALSGRMGAAS